MTDKYRELEAKVLEWAEDREILSKATPKAQVKKTKEEVDELFEAICYQQQGIDGYLNDKNQRVWTTAEIQDAFGDILVTLIIGAKLQHIDLLDCLESAYNVIAKRTGKMVDGQFKKDE